MTKLNLQSAIKIERLRYRKWQKWHDGGEIASVSSDITAVNTGRKMWVLASSDEESIPNDVVVVEHGCFSNRTQWLETYRVARQFVRNLRG